MKNLKKIITWIGCCALAFMPALALAERVKDISQVQGVRGNQLVGYGLVVGLPSSGDQVTQTPFTVQSIKSMLAQPGRECAAQHQSADQERGGGDGARRVAAFRQARADHRCDRVFDG